MNRISNLRGTVMSLEFRVEKKKEQRQKCQGQLWKFMYSSFFLRKKKTECLFNVLLSKSMKNHLDTPKSKVAQ